MNINTPFSYINTYKQNYESPLNPPAACWDPPGCFVCLTLLQDHAGNGRTDRFTILRDRNLHFAVSTRLQGKFSGGMMLLMNRYFAGSEL